MKPLVILLCILLALVVFVMPVITTAAANAKVQPTPVRSGEVENPVIHQVQPTPTPTHTTVSTTPTPTHTSVSATPTTTHTTVSTTQTPTHTTVSATPTPTHTSVSATQTTVVPVVTVTVFVYPFGEVYRPPFYYPPYYSYPDTSYYPSLTVTSNPSGATVILDGYNYGTTPYIFTGLTTGYHTVEVDYPGYEAYVTHVYVDNAENQEVYADLTALVSYGSLFIDSSPRGADVYVDGNYQGTSPVTVSALSIGAHQVELHLAGYEVMTSTQYVDAGQGTVVNLYLTPYSSASAYGSIGITSNLPGAGVYLDGTYKGSLQSGTIYNIISVSPGSHTLFLHLPGYNDITQTVEVYGGQISEVNAVFTSLSSPQTAASSTATGSVIVTSAPAGGQVYVDNQFRGVAPVTIYNVAAGTHIINLQLSGYSDWSTSVNVPANQVVQVPATLVPGSGTTVVPTRAGLSLAVTLCALAAGAVMISDRIRK